MIDNNLKNSYIYSFIIFIFILISILFNSFMSINGNLTPDSKNYLALAQNLINNESFYLNYIGMENKWFSAWPLGYPTMIFLIAKTTGVSVFLASKLLNLLIIGIIFIFFNYKFKENGFVFSSIFLLVPFMAVFSHTWSEAPFILGIFLFSLSLHNYIKAEKINYKMLFAIIITAILMFLSRYIGAFSVGVIGLAIIYLVYLRSFKKAFLLVIPILVCSVFFILYLYNNYLQTGYPTGIERVPANESIVDLIKMTTMAFLVEINLLTIDELFTLDNFGGYYFGFTIFSIVLLLQCYIFYIIFKKYSFHNISLTLKDISMWKIFLIIGLLYYGAIVFMRWTSLFDALNFRLLIPGTFMILVSLILFSKEYLNAIGFYRFKLSFVVIAILSFCIFTFRPYVKPVLMGTEIKTYSNFVNELHQVTENIPSKSVIVMGNNHLYYIRPDLINISPHASILNLNNAETWDDFLLRVISKYPEKNIFLYIENIDSTNSITNLYHSSVVDIIKENQERKIIKLQ